MGGLFINFQIVKRQHSLWTIHIVQSPLFSTIICHYIWSLDNLRILLKLNSRFYKHIQKWIYVVLNMLVIVLFLGIFLWLLCYSCWFAIQQMHGFLSFIVRFKLRVSNNSELKGAHFRILPKKVAIFAKNVRFLYYKEANKKRHLPLKVAPMCAKAHIIRNSEIGSWFFVWEW